MDTHISFHPAAITDLPAILALQRLAFQSEAELLGKPDIPPLRQRLPDLETEYRTTAILKAVDGTGAIIGSVRCRIEGDTGYIGKLMVHPAHQGKGLGSRLLTAVEAACPAYRYELFTSILSERNLALYERMGYRRCKEREIAPGIPGVFLEKIIDQMQ